MAETPVPLPLPENFNPETSMLMRTVDGQPFHQMYPSAELAGRLVANGAPQDLALAEKVLAAVLDCQERRPGDPHYGNFRWEREDEFVEDLNAVQFALINFIPMLLRHGDRLSPAIRAQVEGSIRLGLEAIRRIDVSLIYTNIAIKDIANTCLGGELLDEPGIARRGYDKLVAWLRFTDRSGFPYEFNSPTYTRIAIQTLHQLAALVRDEATRILAKTMLARLGLSVVLHIHPGTGRWAGPYSRAYQPTVICDDVPDFPNIRGRVAEVNTVRQWLADGVLPGWLADALDHRPTPLWVAETSDAAQALGNSTYHSRSFALGVASRELSSQANRYISGQSNVFIAHYTIPGEARPGVIFSRYLLDDKWLGDYQTTPSRSRFQLLPEEGRFFGVQDGARAIALYTPFELGARVRNSSAKASLIWSRRDRVDEIWIGGNRVERLPAEVPPGRVVVVGSGDALAAVLPLARTQLSHAAPLRLVEIGDYLALEMYNYLGPAKTFWELAWPGAFYQGRPQCGFYAELAERGDYPDGRAFGEVVAAGALTDEAEAPFTYVAGTERLWTVQYARDGRTLGLEVDLMDWRLKRRWTQAGELGWPMLESPVARESRTGEVVVGEARLTCGPAAAWLFASPETGRWAAAYHGLEPAPLTLSLPAGRVEIEAMGAGLLVWDNGRVAVEAMGLRGSVRVSGGRPAG